MSGLAIAGSLLGGLFSSRAASKAADAQTEANERQMELAREVDARTTGYYQPYRQVGGNALNALNYEILGGARPMMTPSGLQIEEVQTRGPDETVQYMDGGAREGNMATKTIPGAVNTSYTVGGQSFDNRSAAQSYLDSQGTEYGGFTKTPGYDFRLNQGRDAIEGSAAMRGGLFSGSTLKSLENYGQDYASNEYGNYLNQLSGLTNMGSAAAGNMASSGANMLNYSSQALSGIGNAQAAGYIGGANAINQGFGNALGAYQYQQMIDTL